MHRHLRHVIAFAFTAWWLAACAGSTAIPAGESVVEGQVRVLTGEIWPSDASAIEVAVRQTSIATRVGADGRFVLDGVPAGDVELVFRGPWGEAGVWLEAVARGQTLRVEVALGAEGAALEAVSRSSDDLVLSILPDRWQLAWLEPSGESPVVAMITGDDAFLDRLDLDCFQLVGDLAGADPLVPNDVLVGTKAVALRFAGADALALLAAPFAGSQRSVEVGFCFQADGGAEAESDVLVAELHFLTATITVADDQAPDTTGFTAEFVPDSIPLAPGAEDTVRLIVRGPAEELDDVVGGRLRLVDDSGDADGSLPEAAVLDDGENGVDGALDVVFSLVTEGEDAPFLEARQSQIALVELVGAMPGSYDLTLALALAEDEVTTAADAPAEILVVLTVVDDADDTPSDDGLAAEFQPAAWNTNWHRVGSGWVTVKISGTGFAEIDLDAVALSASAPGSEGSEPEGEGLEATRQDVGAGEEQPTVLTRERAQRQGNHVRAFFRQRDAIGLLDDPVPGDTYDLWVLVGDGAALPVTVTITGPPH